MDTGHFDGADDCFPGILTIVGNKTLEPIDESKTTSSYGCPACDGNECAELNVFFAPMNRSCARRTVPDSKELENEVELGVLGPESSVSGNTVCDVFDRRLELEEIRDQ